MLSSCWTNIQAETSTVQLSLIKNGLYGRVAVKEGEQGEKANIWQRSQ